MWSLPVSPYISVDHLTHSCPDQIRPDWEEKLATVKAAVTRRANRRIIMRQVGDRLIPVGITSSRTQLPEGITTVEVSCMVPPYVLVLM